MPGLIEQFREEGSIEEAGALDIWLTVILSLNGEFETLRRHYDYRIKTNPLNAGIWSSRAAILSKLGEFDAAEDAIERGQAMAGDHPWPQEELLRVYNETGDAARAGALTKRIDDLAAGPAILGRTIAIAHNMLFFDLADAPNFAARLEEAGIDPESFRPMPRHSLQTE